MRTLSTLLLLAAVSAAVGAGDPLRGEVLAGSCNACHGPEGRGSPPLPPLRGRSDLGHKLQAWKQAPEASGEDHVMIRFARGLSNTDIDDLAAYYAQQDAP